MSETIQHARKVGGSIMITIPKEIVEIEGIHAGELVKIHIQKIRKDWFGACKGIGGKLAKEEKLDVKWSKFK
jgi:antitoxin component of MazEF toxin-antitoxin module